MPWPGAAAMTDVAPGPLAATSVFLVVVALSAGLELRARTRLVRAGAHPRGDRAAAASDAARLIGLLAGAALVSALATPALAATEAGESAVPHGTHELDREAPAPGVPEGTGADGTDPLPAAPANHCTPAMHGLA